MKGPLPQTLEVPPALADLAFRQSEDSRQSRSLAWASPGQLGINLEDPEQRRFGDYELLEAIGRGGMGAVFRARQHSLDREVALKFLAAGPWASDEFVARFRREAQAAARMQHPNIVEIYDTGERDGLYYFSMRLVRGHTLAQRLQTDGLPSAEAAAALLRTLAEAIDYAHRLGVLHLDLKPGNVLLESDDVPLIADFGLARRIDEGPSGEVEEVSGTPSYMAPEQAMARKHRVGPAADIYGLGAILYELLTGVPPFLGRDVAETLRRVAEDEPSAPRAHRRNIPADLEAICLKCLAKDPAQRYASARELADELGRFLEGRPVCVRPLGRLQRTWRWARREPLLAGLALTLLLSLSLGVIATGNQWLRAERALQLAQARQLEAESERNAAESRAREFEQASELVLGLVLGDDPDDLDQVAVRASRVVTQLDQLAATDSKVVAAVLRRLVSLLDARLGTDAAQVFILPIVETYGARFRADLRQWWAGQPDADAALLAAVWSRPGDSNIREHVQDRSARAAPPNSAFSEAMREALARRGDDPLTRYVDALWCTAGADTCADRASAARLLELAPDNAVHHLLAAHFVKDAGEVRALLRQAAVAPRYDDHFAQFYRLYLRGVREAGVVIPDILGMPLRGTSSPDSADFLVSYFEFQLRPAFSFQPFANLCRSAAVQTDPELATDCIAFFEKAHGSAGGMLHKGVGTQMLRRLIDDPHRQAELLEQRRRYLWMLECPRLLEATPGPRELSWEWLMQESAQVGELEAFFRRAARLGCGDGPDSDWQPADPARLKPG